MTARPALLCMETIRLHRLNKRSSGIGLLTSCAAAVHGLGCAAVFLACCCACDVLFVHHQNQEMNESGATTHAQVDPTHASHGAFLASPEQECRPCDKYPQAVSVAFRKPLLKTRISPRILERQIPPPSDRFGALPVLYAHSLYGRSEASLQTVRVTVLLI